ncbi:uncharacterized protein LOC9647484 [Selaginella moellendorffii]|uniref:uncharacterized protein LOC9647484 n=1 Tax=Selaginella moellendorffii TaxID=88036 RepID=UPI000D1C9EFB|nr:uncharacterized protein LOC9647484 [Selaginella moellendorffii]|eukprot:XP_024541004.1 uncharacterized protein LOC9647484 [Selaginella moellendorffii]
MTNSASLGRNGCPTRTSMENIKQPKYGYARARGELQRGGSRARSHEAQASPLPKSPQHHHHSKVSKAKRMRFLTKSDKGWSWLSVQMRDVASEVKMGMARKGELPQELVQALWGRQGPCCKGQEALADHIDHKLEKKLKSKGKGKPGRKPQKPDTRVYPDEDDKALEDDAPKTRKSRQKKIPETLMDVLLAKWVYFDHSHADVSQVDKHIHAKYCENAFGHFLFPDGRQVHGSYSVPLSYLVQELRKLLTHLRSKIVNTHYKDLPIFSPPEQQILPEFEPPEMKPLPQLYPIDGLFSIPTEESEGIGPSLELPVFEAPVPKELPALDLPPPLRVSPLKIPPQPIFLEDENSIDRTLYKEDPLPTYYAPEKLPLPQWVEPKLLDFPSAPIPMKVPVLPMPVMEALPPFVAPIPEPRPCEKAYYAVDESFGPCCCEGKCMPNVDMYARKGKPCQAKPRALLPYPESPYPLPLVLKPEPVFLPPVGEPLPEFHPPALKVRPAYVPPPPLVLPPWKPPPAPDPIGYLAGQRPIFLIDASGTMAKGGMKMAHDILTAVFSPRGQVAIAATHFDIIMYSFDAWSYASMENYRLQAMIEKTPASLEEALNWALRWGAGGPTNLLKALDVSFSRSFCDCIYLLTDGKPDKPVLVMQQIKKLLKMQGAVTPLYTVGLGTTKYGERFLQRISELTGGVVRHVDRNWATKPPPVSGVALEDMLWAKSIIEGEQRRNIVRGMVETIHDLEEKVRLRYDKERNAPRLAAYQKNQKKMEEDYEALIKSIDEENEALLAAAKRKYEDGCKDIIARNMVLHDFAREKWLEECRRVEQLNQRAVEEIEKWKRQVKHIDEENARLVAEAKKQYEKDVKWVEEMNALSLKQAMEEYEVDCLKKKTAFEFKVKETERQQKEMEETVATRNRINQENHAKMVAEITQTNKETTEKAHADHAARVAYIESENARIKKESEDAFQSTYDKVKLENARRVAALKQKIQDLKENKEKTLSTYKAELAAAMAEHEAQSKKFAKLNQETEERARANWKLACEAVAAENMAIAKAAVEEYERQSKFVHEENMRRASQIAAMLKKKAEVEAQNEEVTRVKKIQWKAACAQAEVDYETDVTRAKEEHEKLSLEVNAKNSEAFQEALLEHKAKVAAVKSYNETIRPFVEASILVKAEIARVEKFIRYIGNACLDPNRKSTDTASDLNVLGKSEQGMETKILVEALQEAYSTKREGGDYVQRPSFYSGKDFSGMIPIHPPRAPQHHCPDLDGHVRLKELELERLRLELEEIKAEEEAKISKEKDKPLFRF